MPKGIQKINKNGILSDTIFLFSDCFSYNNNGNKDKVKFGGFTSIITNDKFDNLDEDNINFIIQGSFLNSTNNFNELLGVLQGLVEISNKKEFINGTIKTIKVISDSEYVIKGLSERMFKWKQNGWTLASGDEVKNLELWKKAVEIVLFMRRKKVNLEFIHQKGHKGKKITKKENNIIYFQEMCDTLGGMTKNKILKEKFNGGKVNG